MLIDEKKIEQIDISESINESKLNFITITHKIISEIIIKLIIVKTTSCFFEHSISILHIFNIINFILFYLILINNIEIYLLNYF